MTTEIKTAKTAVAGVNTLACDCGGTAFIPVSMDMLAKLRVHGVNEFAGFCTRGHVVKVRLRGGSLRSTNDE